MQFREILHDAPKYVQFYNSTSKFRGAHPKNFGPVTPEITRLMFTHQSQIFRKAIFRPLGGAALPNFYTR